uniref:Sorting nexin family member 21 n=1 Tax=Oryzias sinensis TaxID=183150 RepID=A0A8C7YU30_9TELE
MLCDPVPLVLFLTWSCDLLCFPDASPVGVSPVGPSPPSFLAAHLQEGWSWRSLRGLGSRSAISSVTRQTDTVLFEVTDASVIHDGTSKYVLYTIHVIQSGGSDKTPAVITRRYSDFQRLHATLRRNYGDQMERVCFPRKKLRRNFAAETIAVRSRAFEQYLSHLCSISALRGALCVRQFFYLNDLQAGQLLIRSACFQEALGPLLNAKRLQSKLGWTMGLLCCFQEVGQLEEARDHCDHALRVLTPTSSNAEDKPLPPHQASNSLLPLLLPLLRVVVRLSWQTGKDKRQWEELLQHLEEQQAGLDNHPTIQEFLVQHNLQESEGDG